MPLRSPHIENVMKAGELISEVLLTLLWDCASVKCVCHQDSSVNHHYDMKAWTEGMYYQYQSRPKDLSPYTSITNLQNGT